MIERPFSRWHLFAALAIAAAALLVYGQSLSFHFVNLDDALLIYQNPKVWGLSLANLRQAFTTYDPELYIPLTILSYQIDYAIGGLNPMVFHLTNLVLHTLNAILVMCVFALLMRANKENRANMANRYVPFFIALLFLVHPLNTEAVVWASGRKDLLSTAFLLSSIGAYLRFREAERQRWYWGSVALFTIGLLAKVSIVMLPAILLLIDDLRGRPLWTRAQLREKFPYLLVAVCFGIVALYGKATVGSSPLIVKALLFLKSIFFYVEKIAWPYGFSVLYPWIDPIRIGDAAFLIPALLLPLTLTAALVLRRRSAFGRSLFFGWAFYLVALAPSFFNLTKGIDRYLASDRYAYVAMIGILFLLATAGLRLHALFALRGRGAIAARGLSGLAAALVVFLSVRAHTQAKVWSSATTLYSDVLARNSHVAHMDLGTELREQGKLDEALKEFEEALRLQPNDEQALYNRAITFEQMGRLSEAEQSYRRALEVNPYYAVAHINLGRLLYEQGRKQEAEEEFALARSSAPYLAMPPYNLGVLAAERGDLETAAARYREAIANDTALTDARVNLIAVLLQMRRREEAAAAFDDLREADPDDPRIPAIRKALNPEQ